MASKEFRRPDWSKPYMEKNSHKYRPEEPDPLFDRDWEVFVIRRDSETGAYATQTACCEENLETA
jgi:hypothetical protein